MSGPVSVSVSVSVLALGSGQSKRFRFPDWITSARQLPVAPVGGLVAKSKDSPRLVVPNRLSSTPSSELARLLGKFGDIVKSRESNPE